ncbi:MAG: hypothetical protein GZ089_04535 [Aromatoleum sp.]|nr:hypothetical protein [Aromatoleum sp.]
MTDQEVDASIAAGTVRGAWFRADGATTAADQFTWCRERESNPHGLAAGRF